MDEEVYNKSLIAWVCGHNGEKLHSFAVLSLAFGSGKYFCTLVQYLAILTASPCNEVYLLHYVRLAPIRMYRQQVCDMGPYRTLAIYCTPPKGIIHLPFNSGWLVHSQWHVAIDVTMVFVR